MINFHTTCFMLCLSFFQVRSQKFKPLIERINSTFTYHSFTQKRDVYNYMADATNRTAGDIVWTNQNKFNQLEFDLEAYVDTSTVFPNNPSLPSYIMETKLGIVAASVKIIHEKLRKGKINVLLNNCQFKNNIFV